MKNSLFKITASIIFSLVCISCSHEEKNKVVSVEPVNVVESSIEKGKIISRTTSRGGSFALYLPPASKENEDLPVIIFLDPHGKGSLPIDKYKSLADHFNFMLIGSNDSRNGMDFEKVTAIADDLNNEAVNVLHGKQGDISIAGFSGGAKAALVCGNALPGFSNIIYCGAALPPGSIELNKPMIGFAGHKDMNYTEIVNFNAWSGKEIKRHCIVEWQGKHEWPDTAVFSHAFYWHLINSIKQNIAQSNPDLVKAFKEKLNLEIQVEKNPIVKAALLTEGCKALDSIVPIDDLLNRLSVLINSSSFRNANSKQDVILASENKRKNEYLNSFENRDLQWWSGQVAMLTQDGNNESNQRILGYISLASWSYSTKALASGNYEFAHKVLRIYKLADPANSEQPFLMACLYSKNQMADSAIYFLKEAVQMGLNDRGKIEQEKLLESLHGNPEFQNILNNLKI